MDEDGSPRCLEHNDNQRIEPAIPGMPALNEALGVPSGLLRVRKPAGWRRGLRCVLVAGVRSYALAVAAVWGLIHFGGDRWWFATVMLFAPRWLYALPLVALLPWIPLVGLRAYWPLLPAAAILVGPIMGLCIPWQAWLPRRTGPAGVTRQAAPVLSAAPAPESGHAREPGRAVPDESGLAGVPTVLTVLRVFCCNVDGTSFDPAALRALMTEYPPDMVALQEFGGEEAELFGDRHAELSPGGWHIERAGGLLIASRWPILRRETHQRQDPPSRWPSANSLYCVIDTPAGPVGLCNVHFRTARWGLNEVLDRRTLVNPARSGRLREETAYRRAESERAARWLQGLDDSANPRIIAGDLNMPVDSAIYRDVWAEYGNAFCQAGFGFGGTKRTVVRNIEYGLRIDHVLFDSRWRARRAWVGSDIGSDHLPLVVELEL